MGTLYDILEQTRGGSNAPTVYVLYETGINTSQQCWDTVMPVVTLFLLLITTLEPVSVFNIV